MGWNLQAHANRLEASVGASLSAGSASLQSGRALLKDANRDRRPEMLQQAQTAFTAAKASFNRAIREADSDRVLRVVASIPGLGPAYVGPRQQTLDALSRMGIALSDAGLSAVEVDATILQPDPGSSAGTGQRLVSFLEGSRPMIDTLGQELSKADRLAASVDSALIPTAERRTFEAARTAIRDESAGMAEFRRLAAVLLQVLGANGPRTYLVENVDNANLQGSGGYVGSYSLLSTNLGDIRLAESADVGKIDVPYPLPGQQGYVREPAPLRQWTGDHGWRLGDALAFPDFPAAAKTSMQLYQNESGRRVDGVIALDPYAVAELLAVTGPVDVPEYGTKLQSGNFPDVVYQREEFRGTPGHPGYPYDGKKFVTTAAAHVVAAVLKLRPASWPALLEALNRSVVQRHLQVYLDDPAAEAEITRVGWAGTILGESHPDDYIAEVENNYGDSKANHFVSRRFELTLSFVGGKLRHHLQVTVDDQAPPGYAGGQQYWAYVRLYLPARASDKHTAGLTPDKIPSDEKPPPGLAFLDGWIYIDPGRSGDSEARFSFDWSMPLSPSDRPITLYWRKQAGTLGDSVRVVYHTSAAGNAQTITTDLLQDRVITLSGGITARSGQAASASLPLIGS